MKRTFTSHIIKDYLTIKDQVLSFGNKFGTFCLLDNHGYDFRKSYDCIAGAGVVTCINTNKKTPGTNLKKLDNFKKENEDWIFGHLSYDVKNEVEDLSSTNFDGIQFPEIFFFVPEIVFIFSNKVLNIGVFPEQNADTDCIFKEIVSTEINDLKQPKVPALKSRYSKEEYIKTVGLLQKHISKGDCYEINFCQEFYTSGASIDPIQVHRNLNAFSPNPFSAFYKCHDKFLMCASPERFLKREANALISQPIKGTAKRILADKEADNLQREALIQNDKERSENIMIVDLVRNDLSKVCAEGTVRVEDFLGAYTFPQVHQLISTVTGILKEKNIKLSEIFRATFPMGSMTGAPKKRVMELIEKYERTKRGLFSGTIGYIDPHGNFDFNVVIRGVQFNATSRYVSIIAGSAITHCSNPENEYEECLLKISAMKKALE